MASSQVEYKQKLRKQSPSQIGEEEEEISDEVKSGNVNEVIIEEENQQSGGKRVEKKSSVGTQVELEVPVVNMEDFETVDFGDKMNLLMSAINKINTNFHLKWDAIQKQIKEVVGGVNPRVAALEKMNEEVIA